MGNSLFTLAVKIDTAHLTTHLVEANVVEPLEARTVDRANSVVGHEELLLPAHEYVFPLVHVLDDRLPALARLLEVWPERSELGPVGDVDLFARAPSLVLGDEAVL